MSSNATGATPYYYVPHPSRHPAVAAAGMLIIIFSAAQWAIASHSVAATDQGFRAKIDDLDEPVRLRVLEDRLRLARAGRVVEPPDSEGRHGLLLAVDGGSLATGGDLGSVGDSAAPGRLLVA